jgi:hypothetical protein
VNAALGILAVSNCVAGDIDENDLITVDEIVAAVGNLLKRCVPMPAAADRSRGRRHDFRQPQP